MGTRRPLLAAVPEALGGAPRPAGSVEAARRLAGRLGAAFVPLGEPHGMARVVVREPGPAVVDLADFRGPTLPADPARRDVAIAAPADEPLGSGLTRREVLKLAVLLHDVGKPETRSVDPDGRIRFTGHDRLGA